MKNNFVSHWRPSIRSQLEKAGTILINHGRRICSRPEEVRTLSWYASPHNNSLRFNYDLNSSSHVFDLGGYTGQWASDIFSRYCCFIHVFEPVLEYAALIEQRFARNDKIRVYPFGLANANFQLPIYLCADSSSLFKPSDQEVTGHFLPAVDFLRNSQVNQIDLMKINIEGGEYDLLDHLLNEGVVASINNIQVQFHDFVP